MKLDHLKKAPVSFTTGVMREWRSSDGMLNVVNDQNEFLCVVGSLNYRKPDHERIEADGHEIVKRWNLHHALIEVIKVTEGNVRSLYAGNDNSYREWLLLVQRALTDAGEPVKFPCGP